MFEMIAALERMRTEWRVVVHDRPGSRFLNHHRRWQQHRSTTGAAVRVMAGSGLIAGGVLLWFLPGPGTLVVIAGLALFSGESARLARLLDRGEVLTRAGARRGATWWRTTSPGRRALLILTGLMVVGLGSAAALVRWI